MGLISGLLTLPLAPVRGAAGWLEQDSLSRRPIVNCLTRTGSAESSLNWTCKRTKRACLTRSAHTLEDDLLARLDVARRRRAELMAEEEF